MKIMKDILLRLTIIPYKRTPARAEKAKTYLALLVSKRLWRHLTNGTVKRMSTIIKRTSTSLRREISLNSSGQETGPLVTSKICITCTRKSPLVLFEQSCYLLSDFFITPQTCPLVMPQFKKTRNKWDLDGPNHQLAGPISRVFILKVNIEYFF